jgi:ATP-dependent Lon protease
MNQEKAKVFFLYNKVLFPHCTNNVSLRLSSFSQDLNKGDKIIAFPIRNLFDIFLIKWRVSVFTEITELEKKNDRVHVQLKGISRVRIKKFTGVHEVTYENIQSTGTGSEPELLKNLRKRAQELVFLINVEESDRLIELMNFLFELNQITDFIANYFVLNHKQRIRLLNEINVINRSNRLLSILNQLIKKMEKNQ